MWASTVKLFKAKVADEPFRVPYFFFHNDDETYCFNFRYHGLVIAKIYDIEYSQVSFYRMRKWIYRMRLYNPPQLWKCYYRCVITFVFGKYYLPDAMKFFWLMCYRNAFFQNFDLYFCHSTFRIRKDVLCDMESSREIVLKHQ